MYTFCTSCGRNQDGKYAGFGLPAQGEQSSDVFVDFGISAMVKGQVNALGSVSICRYFYESNLILRH